METSGLCSVLHWVWHNITTSNSVVNYIGEIALPLHQSNNNNTNNNADKVYGAVIMT